jgi:hypothetical protein
LLAVLRLGGCTDVLVFLGGLGALGGSINFPAFTLIRFSRRPFDKLRTSLGGSICCWFSFVSFVSFLVKDFGSLGVLAVQIVVDAFHWRLEVRYQMSTLPPPARILSARPWM